MGSIKNNNQKTLLDWIEKKETEFANKMINEKDSTHNKYFKFLYYLKKSNRIDSKLFDKLRVKWSSRLPE